MPRPQFPISSFGTFARRAPSLAINWHHSIWFLALLAAVIVAWMVGPSDFYTGGDGKWTQVLIKKYLTFTRPFEVNALNPLEGNFSQLFPLNAWLNPAVIQFQFLPFEIAKVTSMITFLAIQALAMYALARQFGMGRISAAIAAQCSAWCFPHFTFLSGIAFIYFINPTVAITVSLFILLLILVIRVGPNASVGGIVLSGIGASALTGLIVYIDPMTMGLVGFCMAPCFLVAILFSAGSLQAIWRRFAVLGIAVCLLLAAGVVQYVLALDYYSYRFFFRTEFPRQQIPAYASMLFFMKAGGITLAISTLGLVLGAMYTRGPALVAVLIGIAAAVAAFAAGLIYLFAGVHWWFPLPVYIQFYSFSFVIIGAVAGYASCCRVVRKEFPAFYKFAPALQIACLFVIPGALVYGAVKLPSIAEAFPDRPMISELFEPDLAIVSGSQWKGSVYTMFRSYREQLTYFSLWDMKIPTHNEYSQTLSPLWYYMTRKVMHVVDSSTLDPTQPLAIQKVGAWDTRLSAAFGIRYIMLPVDAKVSKLVDDDVTKAKDIGDHYLDFYGIRAQSISLKKIVRAAGQGYEDFSWLVYELPEPNYGQYSPTVVKLAGEVGEYRRLFTQRDFDWRRDVVLKQNPGPLTKAVEAKLYIERGYLRVRAQGRGGRSLVLLPVQYSNCLKISGSGAPQLVRANMYFAGMLFSGDSDARIDFDFGVTNSSCRWADIVDLRGLKLAETAEPASIDLFPFALRGASDIRPRWKQLHDIYKTLP
jgi:hypothetical protein